MKIFAQAQIGLNWSGIQRLLGIDDGDIAFLLNVGTAQLHQDTDYNWRESKLVSDVMTLLALLGDMDLQEFVDYLDSLAKGEPARAAGYIAIAEKTKKEL